MNLFLNKICMEEAGAAAGGGTGTGTGTGGAGAGAGAAAGGDPLFDAGKGGEAGKGGTGDPPGGKGVVIPDNWHESISEPVRNEISNLKNFKTVEEFAKSFVNAQKMVGADKIAIPSATTTKEEWRAIQEKLGLPKVVGDYKYAAPEKMPKEFVAGVNKAAYEIGILPNQMEQLMKYLDGENQKDVTAFVSAQTAAQNAGIKALEQEWGDAYPTEIAKAKAAMKELVDPATAEMIRKSGLGRNPAFIKFAAKAGAFLSEDVIRGEGGSTGGGGRLSPEQAQQEITDMNKNMQHPVWNTKHQDHGTAVKRRNELFKMAHGNKTVASVSGS